MNLKKISLKELNQKMSNAEMKSVLGKGTAGSDCSAHVKCSGKECDAEGYPGKCQETDIFGIILCACMYG